GKGRASFSHPLFLSPKLPTYEKDWVLWCGRRLRLAPDETPDPLLICSRRPDRGKFFPCSPGLAWKVFQTAPGLFLRCPWLPVFSKHRRRPRDQTELPCVRKNQSTPARPKAQ